MDQTPNTADRSAVQSYVKAQMSQASGAERDRMLRPAYRNFVLLMVLVGLALSFIDKQIFTVLMQAIKLEFRLSDTTLGLLSGLAFAVFYATLGIPIARIGDRHSRHIVMTFSILSWSLMTVFGSFIHSVLQLYIARVGTGICEAGFAPCGMALLADYFPEKNRGLMLGAVNTGPLIGMMLGLMIGGWSVEAIGWRGAFLIVGAPGIVFGALFWFLVKEPVRGMADGISHREPPAPNMPAGTLLLWRTRAFRYLLLATAFSAVGVYASASWMPSYLMRAHHMSASSVGFILGPVIGLGGGVGVLLGGLLTDQLRRRDARWPMWLPALTSVLVIPLTLPALLAETPQSSLALYVPAYCLALAWVAPTFSLVQALVPATMRATATAWKLLFTQLIGMGLGPAIVGILSDRLALGSGSLRYAMIIVISISLVVAAGLYLFGAQFVLADLRSNSVPSALDAR